MERFPSGQRGQTVNLLAQSFGGSIPPLSTIGSYELGLHYFAVQGQGARPGSYEFGVFLLKDFLGFTPNAELITMNWS